VRKLILPHVLIALSLLLVACGASVPAADTFRAPVEISLATEPSPAAVGDVEIILTLTDGSGQPLEGATVNVSADHTDMTGMTMGGAATEQGAGKYAITADFSMSGNWTLTVYVRKGDIDYKQDLPLVLK
jgi:hypothetical protein